MPIGGEAEARRFFGDLLGLAEIAKPEALQGRGGCWFAMGDRQLHLGVEESFVPAKKAHIAVATDDLPALRGRLAAAGRALRDDAPIEGRDRFFTEDPFGNRLEIVGPPRGRTEPPT